MAKMKPERKKWLIYGGLGALFVAAGVTTTLLWLTDTADDLTATLHSAQGYFSRAPTGADKKRVRRKKLPAFISLRGGERSYRVKEGENIWRIAQKGLVASPWEWRTIVMQNQGKIDFTFISDENQEWMVLVEEGEELTVKGGGSVTFGAMENKPKKKFALQLLNLPQGSSTRAREIVKDLLGKGHYAYYYHYRDKSFKGIRIRSGFFETKAEAITEGEWITAHFGHKNYFETRPKVVSPSARELNGKILKFGVQKAKPWIIQLADQDSHQKALDELEDVSEEEVFAYISQARDLLTGMFTYRVRIGFFATKEQAKIYEADEGPWEGSRLFNLKGFKESLPGQTMRFPRK